MNQEQATSLLRLAEEVEGMHGRDEAAGFDRLEAQHEDLLAALSWFLEHGEPEQALRLGAALYSFWHTRGYAQEGREWLRKILAVPGAPSSVQAKALHRAGMLAFRGDDPAGARAFFDQGLEMARRLGDQQQTAAILLGLGRLVGLRQGDYAAGHRFVDESQKIARLIGDQRLEGSAIHCLAALARLEGDYTRAVSLYMDSLNLCREVGDAGGLTVEQLNLGFMTLKKNDIDAAREWFTDSLRSAHERKDSYVIAPNLLGLADVAARSGDPDRAARLLGSAESVLEKAALVWDPDDRLEYDRIVEAIRDELGSDRMNARVTEGRAMRADDAIASALATAAGAQPSER